MTVGNAQTRLTFGDSSIQPYGTIGDGTIVDGWLLAQCFPICCPQQFICSMVVLLLYLTGALAAVVVEKSPEHRVSEDQDAYEDKPECAATGAAWLSCGLLVGLGFYLAGGVAVEHAGLDYV